MLQEFRRHDGAHGVAAEILRTGAAAAVPVEARERIGAALFKRPPSTFRSVTPPILWGKRQKFRRTTNL